MIKKLTVVVALLSLFCGVCFAGEKITLNKIVYELFNPSSGIPYARIVESRYSKDTPFTLTIPSEIKVEGTTYKVREINEDVFRGSAITKVVIPGTIESIRDYTFSSESLKEVVLEFGYEKIKIQRYAFAGAPIEYVSLDREILFDYNLDSNNSSYWENEDTKSVFGTNIREVEIGSSVKFLTSCFANCSKLESVHIPETLEEIGARAFKNCTSLKEITIPGTLKEIGYRSFIGCNSLKKVVFEYGIQRLVIGIQAFSHSGVQQVILNRDMANDGAIFDYTELSKVEIGPDVTYIAPKFFQGSYYLRSIKIPGTVKSIGESAFENCQSLRDITFEEGITEINSWAFSRCNSLESITLPEGVQDISRVFANCNNLKRVNLPSTLVSIGFATFRDCANLEQVALPSNLREIGEEAFKNCEKLTSISIPGMVRTIQSEAFANVPLTSMTIEDSDSSIKLTISITCFLREGVREWVDDINGGYWTYKDKSVLPTTIKSFYLGRNVVLDYTGVNDESVYNYSLLAKCHLDDFTMLPKLKDIPRYFFKGWTEANWPDITSIKLPFSVLRLGMGCFQDCEGLKEIILPPSVKEIGANAFMGSSLRKLYVMRSTPPEAPYDPFDDDQYAEVELIVPTEAVDLYKSTEPWSKFSNIVGSDFASVDEVEVSDDVPVEWYDFKGMKVSGENMPACIYLRRQGSKVEKVIIR